MQPKILISDDHNMIRKGLKLYLQFNLGFRDIEETSSLSELMTALKRKKYTHLILDIILSDGSARKAITVIRELYPALHIMVFSMQPAEVYGDVSKKSGVLNYLSKSAAEEEIIISLKRFLYNEQPLPGGKMQQLTPFAALSPRELEVLHYLLKGMRTKEVSELLNIRMNTVSTLKNRIFEKTASNNLRDLIQLAALYNVNY